MELHAYEHLTRCLRSLSISVIFKISLFLPVHLPCHCRKVFITFGSTTRDEEELMNGSRFGIDPKGKVAHGEKRSNIKEGLEPNLLNRKLFYYFPDIVNLFFRKEVG